MAVNITVISLILLASLSLQAALAATQEEIFKRFQDCINRCSLINKECNKAILNLWDDFFSNRKTITRHLRKCCLRNEYREDAHPNDSFGACARINCGAMLWGLPRLPKFEAVETMAKGLLAWCFLFSVLVLVSHTQTTRADERFDRFKACVEECSQMNSRCNDKAKDMWVDYQKNRAKIMTLLRRCCLRNENRRDAVAEDSFAACTKLKCSAMLWG
ncbi:unnamed protein product [Mesocestoides corti]|uniref:Saposin B-type domain-containing protein n=1 Tax=Mesocestoides corti TaxID=53468 RepID=A0A0R3UGK1_MESCO|nr:unnamed protein product [Mesocestoides corti]